MWINGRRSEFAHFAGLQIDADSFHHQISQHAEEDAGDRHDDDGEHGEPAMAFVVQIRPPGHDAGEISGVGHNDDLLCPATGSEGCARSKQDECGERPPDSRELLFHRVISGRTGFGHVFEFRGSHELPHNHHTDMFCY